jgi:hypothetical protein
MLFNIGKFEWLVIAIILVFFVIGLPTMGYLLSRAGARLRRRIVRFLDGVKAFWRGWRA